MVWQVVRCKCKIRFPELISWSSAVLSLHDASWQQSVSYRRHIHCSPAFCWNDRLALCGYYPEFHAIMSQLSMYRPILDWAALKILLVTAFSPHSLRLVNTSAGSACGYMSFIQIQTRFLTLSSCKIKFGLAQKLTKWYTAQVRKWHTVHILVQLRIFCAGDFLKKMWVVFKVVTVSLNHIVYTENNTALIFWSVVFDHRNTSESFAHHLEFEMSWLCKHKLSTL